MDITQLQAMVEEDRRCGLTPFLVVGTAGSVNVGSIDDLDALADAAEAHRLWLHVDGAFGATAVLSDEVRPRLKGMERAASLAFDFHKWMHVNYDCGCVLIRDGDAHLSAFSDRAQSLVGGGGGGGKHSPDYLAGNTRGLAANSPWPVDFGLELSRGFRALKVWSHLLEHGTGALGAAITANLRHAEHLAARVDVEPSLTRLAPLSLQIVVFRYEPAGLLGGDGSGVVVDAAALDALNDEIVVELQERGTAVPSTTRIRGRLAIRINLTNHRTRFEDLDLLVDEVCRIGAMLSGRRGWASSPDK